MTTPFLRPEAVAEIDGVDYDVEQGDVSLDSSRVPYAEATTVLPFLDDTTLDWLDPRAGIRVPLSCGDATDVPRVFNLGLRARTVDHVAKTVTLRTASDEAILQRYTALADDRTPLTLASSLRAVVNHVLAAAIPTSEPNPTALATGVLAGYASRFAWTRSFVTGDAGLGPVIGVLSAARFTSPEAGALAGRGMDSYGTLASASPGTTGDYIAGPTVTPGETITVSRYVRSSFVAPTGWVVGVRFHDGAGNWSDVATYGPPASAGGWARPYWTGVAPAGAVRYSVTLRPDTSPTFVIGSWFEATALQTDRPSLAPFHLAGLQLGTDADVTPLWSATNVVGNSGFEGASVAGYPSGSNVSGQAINTTVAGYVVTGLRSLRYTSTTATNSRLEVGLALTTFKVTPGRTYQFAFWHREHASQPARSGSFGMRWYNADGDLLSTDVTNFTSPNTDMQRFSMSARAPVGAASVWPYITTLGNAAGNFHYLDDVQIIEGEFLPPFFDGNTPDTADYDYTWAGVANMSQSSRTALVDAPEPDAFVWRAGQKAWDFLMPITASAGMVLWCDESRKWYLQTPEERAIASTLYVSPLNTRDGTDTLSLDDDDTTITGVVVLYTWTDRDGISQERVDSAGTSENVLTLELNQAYPGPGAAAAMLARRQGTGRAQDVVCISDWTATPGQSMQITLPGAPDTTGRLVSVTWDLEDSFMAVGASGLVDIIPGSIATLVGPISGLAGTIAAL